MALSVPRVGLANMLKDGARVSEGGGRRGGERETQERLKFLEK